MHPPDQECVVRPLLAGDAAAILALLRAQSAEYLRFFHALPREESALADILETRRKDVYHGIFEDEQLVGFFMLRGWDAGYAIPSFGLFVGETTRGRGYLFLSLSMAAELCREAGAPRFMAKIHPENLSPPAARRLHLVATGVEAETGNVIYHREVEPTRCAS
jgi:RimJ/RimL family protein N-acetyltransferase